jgi:signal transduction histidine kinase
VIIEIRDQFRVMSGWLAVILLSYLALIVTISIVFTHRLIGPTIAFRRHIRALTEGKYQSRVVLRKGDAFIEVADDLNKLAETLEKKRS